jgi:predicted O-methyltransferase YrrM
VRGIYVRIVRILAAVAESTGVLPFLRRRASSSRRMAWVASLLAIYEPEHLIADDVAWWTYKALDEVDAVLRRRDSPQAFEWGSGASTVWLARRCVHVTTIEHDVAWAERLRPLLPENVHLRVVEPQASGQPRTPSMKRGFEGLDFTDYVAGIDRDDASYDVIVVDGRARSACLSRALAHLAPGGVIVLDNVERRRYRQALRQHKGTITVTWCMGLTPTLPYPTATALVRRRGS